jgi:hypothetical protein
LDNEALSELPAVKAGLAGYIHASVAASTWSRYATGWRAFQNFQIKAKKEFTWPLSKKTLQAFAGFCLVEKKLKPSSIKTYLSSLVMLHKLKGFDDYKLADGAADSILRGASNALMANPEPPAMKRRAMTLPMLKLLGHQLAGSGWLQNTQQTVWAACLVGFFSSARMGELLAPTETGLDPTATLTWDCVRFCSDGSILIHIRLPKMSTKEGDFLDLFPFPDPSCCPVAALTEMYWQQREVGLGRKSDAVFTFISGKQLTMEGLNTALRAMLEPLFDFSEGSISCHSFRAALPSALAARPDVMLGEDIKNWGRWSSDAYQSYTRLKHDQKKILYEKIVNALLNPRDN